MRGGVLELIRIGNRIGIARDGGIVRDGWPFFRWGHGNDPLRLRTTNPAWSGQTIFAPRHKDCRSPAGLPNHTEPEIALRDQLVGR